jgi:hypothetical protein
MSVHIPIIVEEKAGIARMGEPIVFGVPFPCKNQLNAKRLSLRDPKEGILPIQSNILARWPNGNVKWVLIDAKINLAAGEKKTLVLFPSEEADTKPHNYTPINCIHNNHGWIVDTGSAVFHLSANHFKPFEAIVMAGSNILDKSSAGIFLEDIQGLIYQPVIHSSSWETNGPLRSTITLHGSFDRKKYKGFIQWHCRLSFYAESGVVKMDFSVHNPRAAKHPGGLWDLGDTGSIYFKDLSIQFPIVSDEQFPEAIFSICEDPVPMIYDYISEAHARTFKQFSFNNKAEGKLNIRLYQDSSGGDNWKSRNHVNRHNEVKTSFRGYKLLDGEASINEGLRAIPILTINNSRYNFGTCLKHFWQNFPKALEIDNSTCRIRLFPRYYADQYELQGGEAKSHTLYMSVSENNKAGSGLEWTHTPIVPSISPAWIEETKAVPYFVPRIQNSRYCRINDLIDTSISGDNTIFHRREIIDEYGWRSFGDLYADHEAVGHKIDGSFISHYNNQYDCLYSMLLQFMSTGDLRWFFLSDQLSHHLKDIDIYHTDNDRPEYCHGLFWHTQHFTNASTATHRCYSRNHVAGNGQTDYGGGPSLAHLYSEGLLLHYYLTGDNTSREALLELALFIKHNIIMETTQCKKIYHWVRRFIKYCIPTRKAPGLVQINKVYNLDGPGRASGNALHTLLDAYNLTGHEEYAILSVTLIKQCIGPKDSIAKRELMDVENRWMYTIFLQSLERFLDCLEQHNLLGEAYEYGRKSLLHYARWMLENESTYLTQASILEYPNETWAAQDLRKAIILLSSVKLANNSECSLFRSKALCLTEQALDELFRFPSKTLTRPLAIVMQNCMPLIWLLNLYDNSDCSIKQSIKEFAHSNQRLLNIKRKRGISMKSEYSYIKWHILSKLLGTI